MAECVKCKRQRSVRYLEEAMFVNLKVLDVKERGIMLDVGSALAPNYGVGNQLLIDIIPIIVLEQHLDLATIS